MQYLKRNTKYSILAFLVIVLSITTSISTLAKTEVYFFLYDNPQILSITSLKPEIPTTDINTASQDEFIKILQISESLTHIPEITSLEQKGRKEEGIIINIE